MKDDLPPLEFTPSSEDGERPKSYTVVHRPGQCAQVIPLAPQKSLAEHEEILKEKFPRIQYQIRSMWGTQEAHDRMAHLLWSDSQGREGFPSDVILALMTMFMEHGEVFKLRPTVHPKGKTTKPDVW